MRVNPLRSRAVRLAFAFLVLAFCAAPVPGDAGGCTQRAEELDPEIFLTLKADIDCDRCITCGFESDSCTRSCEGPVDTALPRGCVALVHDGEVCLRALLDASCADYRPYVRDANPTTPTECNFCPRSSR